MNEVPLRKNSSPRYSKCNGCLESSSRRASLVRTVAKRSSRSTSATRQGALMSQRMCLAKLPNSDFAPQFARSTYLHASRNCPPVPLSKRLAAIGVRQ